MTLPSEELRCMFTRNLCGTDTHMLGHPCECVNCRVSAQVDTLLARVAELENGRAAAAQDYDDIETERDRLKEENRIMHTTSLTKEDKIKRLEAELAEARRILGIISKGFHLLAHPSEGKFESCMWETCQEALAICHSTAKEGK